MAFGAWLSTMLETTLPYEAVVLRKITKSRMRLLFNYDQIQADYAGDRATDTWWAVDESICQKPNPASQNYCKTRNYYKSKGLTKTVIRSNSDFVGSPRTAQVWESFEVGSQEWNLTSKEL